MGTDAGKVVIEGNYLNNITLNNASELSIKNNRGGNSISSVSDGEYRVDTSSNITFTNNRTENATFHADTNVVFSSNVLRNSSRHRFYSWRGHNFSLSNNVYIGRYRHPVFIDNSSDFTVHNDSITFERSTADHGIHISSSNNILIANNYINAGGSYQNDYDSYNFSKLTLCF